MFCEASKTLVNYTQNSIVLTKRVSVNQTMEAFGALTSATIAFKMCISDKSHPRGMQIYICFRIRSQVHIKAI